MPPKESVERRSAPLRGAAPLVLRSAVVRRGELGIYPTASRWLSGARYSGSMEPSRPPAADVHGLWSPSAVKAAPEAVFELFAKGELEIYPNRFTFAARALKIGAHSLYEDVRVFEALDKKKKATLTKQEFCDAVRSCEDHSVLLYLGRHINAHENNIRKPGSEAAAEDVVGPESNHPPEEGSPQPPPTRAISSPSPLAPPSPSPQASAPVPPRTPSPSSPLRRRTPSSREAIEEAKLAALFESRIERLKMQVSQARRGARASPPRRDARHRPPLPSPFPATARTLTKHHPPAPLRAATSREGAGRGGQGRGPTSTRGGRGRN